MDYLPIFADVRNRRVLVVGEGELVSSKIRLLRRAGADIVRRAPAEFRADDISGCAAVFGASGDLAIDRAVAEAARMAGVPVNIVDRPELSTFIIPAIVDRSPLVVAISSGGTAPVLARQLRARLEVMLPARLGDLARLAGRFRHAVRGLVPDTVARRRFWERFFDGPVADQVLAGDVRVDADMVALINRANGTAKGAIYIVGAGSGDADLLTVQALRLMQQADIVAHDEGIAPEILDRARRDAACISVAGEALVGRLAREAKLGKRVVWLVADHAHAHIDELQRRGVEVIVAPGLTRAAVAAWRGDDSQKVAI